MGSRRNLRAVTADYDREKVFQAWCDFFKQNRYTSVLQSLAKPESKGTIELTFRELSNELKDFFRVEGFNTHYIAEQACDNVLEEREIDHGYYEIHIVSLEIEDRRELRDFRVKDISKIIQYDDVMVTVATDVRAKVIRAVFECTVCRMRQEFNQDDFCFTEPLECPKEDGGCGKRAGTTTFRFLPYLSTFINNQRVEVQDPPDHLQGRVEPKRTTVIIEGNLVGLVNPGDRIQLVGIQSIKQKRTGLIKYTEFDTYLKANYIKKLTEVENIVITDEDKKKIEEIKKNNPINLLVNSLAPEIYGYGDIKLAMALQLFGGVVKPNIRGDFHILLLGDPGTAKSKLILALTKFAPISIYSTGSGTSKAGLTASATRDDDGDGRWVLEAGVLVLADKGLAIIDELDKMSKEDRAGLHEALEQQTCTINKATIRAILHARCAVCAAANPKGGKFLQSMSLVEQFDVPAPIMTRFALIFAIKDVADIERDTNIGDVIMKNRYDQAPVADIDPSIWKKYISEAKKIDPVISDPKLRSKVNKEYTNMRALAGNERNSKVISARQFEDILRLAEACARARMSREIDEDDIEVAVKLMKATINEIGDTGEIISGIRADKRTGMEWLVDVLKDGEMDRQSLLALAQSDNINLTNDDLETYARNGMICFPKIGQFSTVKVAQR